MARQKHERRLETRHTRTTAARAAHTFVNLLLASDVRARWEICWHGLDLAASQTIGAVGFLPAAAAFTPPIFRHAGASRCLEFGTGTSSAQMRRRCNFSARMQGRGGKNEKAATKNEEAATKEDPKNEEAALKIQDHNEEAATINEEGPPPQDDFDIEDFLGDIGMAFEDDPTTVYEEPPPVDTEIHEDDQHDDQNHGPPVPTAIQAEAEAGLRWSASRIAQAASPSVVLLKRKGLFNDTSSGSGTAMVFRSPTAEPEEEGEVLIITAAHLVPGGHKFEVFLPADGFKTGYTPSVVGRARGNLDIAVLRLPPEATAKLTPLEITYECMHGELAIAIGHAIGHTSGVELRPAVTRGIVVAPVSEDRPRACDRPFLFTDAALTDGMSGGPLLNADGKVMGIISGNVPDLNTLGNYAIGSEYVRTAAEQIIGAAEKNERFGSLVVFVYKDVEGKYGDTPERDRMTRALMTAVSDLNETMADEIVTDLDLVGRGVVGDFRADEDDKAKNLQESLEAQNLLAEREMLKRFR